METVKDVTFIYGQKSPVRDQVVFFIWLYRHLQDQKNADVKNSQLVELSWTGFSGSSGCVIVGGAH